jgi:hypothetical protein
MRQACWCIKPHFLFCFPETRGYAFSKIKSRKETKEYKKKPTQTSAFYLTSPRTENKQSGLAYPSPQRLTFIMFTAFWVKEINRIDTEPS